MKKQPITLKTWSKYFSKVWENEKTFEIRKFDYPPQVGDEIILIETVDGTTGESAVFTGRSIECFITYVVSYTEFPLGLKEGYYVVGIMCPMHQKIVTY